MLVPTSPHPPPFFRCPSCNALYQVVKAEAGPETVAVFIRDRGVGFDPAAVAADRRGISESIEARMTRAGGFATIFSEPGQGTEVELTLPRDDS